MRFKLRTLLLLIFLCPPLIWQVWQREWIRAGYHSSDKYIVNDRPGYVRYLEVGWLGYVEIGEGDRVKRVKTDFIIFTRYPYYHKKVLLSY